MGTQHKYDRCASWCQFVRLYALVNQSQGFVLPMVTLMGVILITLMTTFLLGAHSTHQSSKVRQSSSGSHLITDSAIARVMAELSKPENSVLLVRNYDPINPENNRRYLGRDGIPNSGDEAGAALDEWSGYAPADYPCFQEKGQINPNIQLTGTIGGSGSYRILAYRYDPRTKSGNVLIQGEHQGILSQLLVSISVNPDLEDFPGLGLIRPVKDYDTKRASLAFRKREVIGKKANVYFDPDSSPDLSVSGRSEPGDANRDSHLEALYASPLDGATQDTISGKIVVCDLNIEIPTFITGTNFGVIDTHGTVFRGVNPTGTTSYRFDKIDLDGNEELIIDTTGGPVVIEATNTAAGQPQIILRHNAKIRNIRTDGQPPRVGDVRILIRGDGEVYLYDTTCIDNVFLYSFRDIVVFSTTGAGCPSGQNTNFEGVIWAEAILSAKNDASNRDINYLGVTGRPEDTMEFPGVTSGIAVPDDVSSLADLLQYTQMPVQYRFGGINSWQRVSL